MNHSEETWPIDKAKERLNELINRVLMRGPQIIMRDGDKVAVVVSAEEWKRKTTRKGSLVEFFASSPLRNSGLKVKPAKEGARHQVFSPTK